MPHSRKGPRRFSELAQAADITATVEGLATRIRGQHPDRSDPRHLGLVGLRNRGVPLAERIADVLARSYGSPVRTGEIGISRHRDDRRLVDPTGDADPVWLGFDPTEQDIVLVDDVIASGRSIRAAMDSIIELGRPRRLEVAVLVDRGMGIREMPIAATYAGYVRPSDAAEWAWVFLEPADEQELVLLGPVIDAPELDTSHPDVVAVRRVLSDRLWQIFVLLARFKTNRAIADELGTSKNTVDKQVEQVLQKLDLERRGQAALLWNRLPRA